MAFGERVPRGSLETLAEEIHTREDALFRKGEKKIPMRVLAQRWASRLEAARKSGRARDDGRPRAEDILKLGFVQDVFDTVKNAGTGHEVEAIRDFAALVASEELEVDPNIVLMELTKEAARRASSNKTSWECDAGYDSYAFKVKLQRRISAIARGLDVTQIPQKIGQHEDSAEDLEWNGEPPPETRSFLRRGFVQDVSGELQRASTASVAEYIMDAAMEVAVELLPKYGIHVSPEIILQEAFLDLIRRLDNVRSLEWFARPKDLPQVNFDYMRSQLRMKGYVS